MSSRPVAPNDSSPTSTRAARIPRAEASPGRMTYDQERALLQSMEECERDIISALVCFPIVRDELQRIARRVKSNPATISTVVRGADGDELAARRFCKSVQQMAELGHDMAADVDCIARSLRLQRRQLDRLSALVGDASRDARVGRAQAGANRARDALVRGHLWLVSAVARKLDGAGLDFDDRVQEGSIGLLTALDKFDCHRDCRFATYAKWWVRRGIVRAVADQGHCVRLPAYAAEARSKIQGARGRADGEHLSQEQLAEAVGLSKERVQEIDLATEEPIRLDAPISESGDRCHSEQVEDTTLPNPEQAVAAVQLHRAVHRTLSCLGDRDHQVIFLRFGLSGDDELSRDEVAQQFGLTRERIRQLETAALERLAHPTRVRELRALIA